MGITEFGVLEALYHKGELPMGEVGDRVLLTSGSTTYVVDKLERRGLVRRRRSTGADRRVTLLSLTAAGRRMMEAIFPAHAEAIGGATSALSLGEKQMAIRLLKQLGLGAQAQREGNRGAGRAGSRPRRGEKPRSAPGRDGRPGSPPRRTARPSRRPRHAD